MQAGAGGLQGCSMAVSEGLVLRQSQKQCNKGPSLALCVQWAQMLGAALSTWASCYRKEQWESSEHDHHLESTDLGLLGLKTGSRYIRGGFSWQQVMLSGGVKRGQGLTFLFHLLGGGGLGQWMGSVHLELSAPLPRLLV